MIKNAFFPIAATLLASITVPAQADSDSANSTPPTIRGAGHGRHAGMKISGGNGKGIKNAIIGDCQIIPSPSNPIGGPCVNLVLVLKEPDGTEAAKNRTNNQGKFTFMAESGKTYHITVASNYFELASENKTVKAGSKISVQLRQK